MKMPPAITGKIEKLWSWLRSAIAPQEGSQTLRAGVTTVIILLVHVAVSPETREFLKTEYGVALVTAGFTGLAAFVALYAAHYPEHLRKKEAKLRATVELSSWGLILENVSAELTVARNDLCKRYEEFRSADLDGWVKAYERAEAAYQEVTQATPPNQQDFFAVSAQLSERRTRVQKAKEERDAVIRSCKTTYVALGRVKALTRAIEPEKVLAFGTQAASDAMQVESTVARAHDSIDVATTHEGIQLSIDYLNKAIVAVGTLLENGVTQARLRLEA